MGYRTPKCLPDFVHAQMRCFPDDPFSFSFHIHPFNLLPKRLFSLECSFETRSLGRLLSTFLRRALLLALDALAVSPGLEVLLALLLFPFLALGNVCEAFLPLLLALIL